MTWGLMRRHGRNHELRRLGVGRGQTHDTPQNARGHRSAGVRHARQWQCRFRADLMKEQDGTEVDEKVNDKLWSSNGRAYLISLVSR